jgi:hypothetical protein
LDRLTQTDPGMSLAHNVLGGLLLAESKEEILEQPDIILY